jgi:hypothetical protein
MIGAQSAMAGKGYWTANNSSILPNMNAYHLFIDGVNPVWGQKDHNSKKIMESSHDGLRLCLGRYVCHRITVTPSAVPNQSVLFRRCVPVAIFEANCCEMCKIFRPHMQSAGVTPT